MTTTRTVVLASASPARRRLLRSAGVEPVVHVSGVDEGAVQQLLADRGVVDPGRICQELASAKAAEVTVWAATHVPSALVVGADSVLDLDGVALGKPADEGDARSRWQAMAGRSGVLCTGHAVTDTATGRTVRRVARTVVRFGRPDEAELLAYLASREPLEVAGAFTLDGLGAPFVDSIEGDPSNVIGLSLPTMRSLLHELGLRFTDLWTAPADRT